MTFFQIRPNPFPTSRFPMVVSKTTTVWLIPFLFGLRVLRVNVPRQIFSPPCPFCTSGLLDERRHFTLSLDIRKIRALFASFLSQKRDFVPSQSCDPIYMQLPPLKLCSNLLYADGGRLSFGVDTKLPPYRPLASCLETLFPPLPPCARKFTCNVALLPSRVVFFRSPAEGTVIFALSAALVPLASFPPFTPEFLTPSVSPSLSRHVKQKLPPPPPISRFLGKVPRERFFFPNKPCTFAETFFTISLSPSFSRRRNQYFGIGNRLSHFEPLISDLPHTAIFDTSFFLPQESFEGQTFRNRYCCLLFPFFTSLRNSPSSSYVNPADYDFFPQFWEISFLFSPPPVYKRPQ